MSRGNSCGCPDCRYDREYSCCPEAGRVEKLERDRARLLSALKEAATLLAWCGGHKNMVAVRKYDRLIAKVEGEK